MRHNARITVIIPAVNEETSIGSVLSDIPNWVDEVIVADNGSSDNTMQVAAEHGARVVEEPRPGYGSACLRGIAALNPCDVVVFLDGDYSDFPEQMDRLVDPIVANETDMVIGSRVLGQHEPGALTPQQRFGNQLACLLLRLFWGVRYTDLGPFRAIRHSSLMTLGMCDPDFGWTVEMQIKATLQGLRAIETPTDYRKRIGTSKISGTVRGVVLAGHKILSTIFTSAFRYYLSGENSSARRRLIIFTRYPEPGKTKTRLIPGLGAEGAADLQRKMTEHALKTASEVEGLELEIRYAGGGDAAMREWLGDEHRYTDQGDGDLGDRMRRALESALSEGVARAAIIGIDCPDISSGILESAFEMLTQKDLVLGPATDGGYYLIGINQSRSDETLPAIFDGIEWGTETVFERTAAIAQKLTLKLDTLVPLDDIDHPEDVARWEAIELPDETPSISVVIPVLNEETHIAKTIASLSPSDSLEVIVVDGGSSDNTAEIARHAGATVIDSPRGRSLQMNRGAAAASGGILLFLHADTNLPADFSTYVINMINMPRTTLGAFRFATDDHGITLRFIGFWVNLRSRLLHMPYGDQALFMEKNLFRTLGGFPEIPIMEDFELVRKAKSHGKIRIAPVPAVTSARRWNRLGRWRTMSYNQFIVAAYLLGVPADRLSAFYIRRRNNP